MADASPKWNKPKAVIKIKKRKPRNNCLVSNENDKSKTNDNGERKERKRKNPFTYSGNFEKRTNLEHLSQRREDTQDIQTSSFLLDGLNNRKQEVKKPVMFLHDPTDNIDVNEKVKSDIIAPITPKIHKGSKHFPIDWSLKTKIRYISSKSFNWCAPLKSAEETAGLSSFVRCQSSTEDEIKDQEAKIEFQKHCMTWMHPNLPWLKLFPRMTIDSKIGKPSTFNIDKDITDALLSDWTKSLTSVFHLLRNNRCPFFYVCGHQFTVLFRAAGIGGKDKVHAIVTPTTRGFREALKKEGLEFSMPLNKEKRRSQESGAEDIKKEEIEQISEANVEQKEDVENDEDDEDIAQTDEGASEWLESIGLNKKQFPTLDPNKIKMQREHFKVIDQRPESMLLVEGPDTLAFFNYLLNCKTCLANTGVQGSIPPTILSPVSFIGATLKNMQVKQTALRQQKEGGKILSGFTVEITGPILPTNIYGLHTLFQKTHEEFTCSYSVHESTAPFNSTRPAEIIEKDEEEEVEGGNNDAVMAEKMGVGNKGLTALSKDNSSKIGKSYLKEMHFESGLYTWNR